MSLKDERIERVKMRNRLIVDKNLYKLELGDLTIWYSYETPIAFKTSETEVVCRQNDFSATTGKHLNSIESDKSKRISGEAFLDRLDSLFYSVTFR